MIDVKGLTKKYGKLVANDNISLQLRAGELGVLLGPNGAGKSTLIKSICGLLRFSGSITVDGHVNRSLEAKRVLGYAPEIPVPYPMLTVAEHMEFIARAYRMDENWRTRAEALMARFELNDKANKLGKELSKGMKQKVSICCAMLPDPKVIIFDEPLSGLDPHGIRQLQRAIEEMREQGKSVLVSTHMIDTVEASWDVTFIMKKGQMVRECRRAEQAETLEDIYFSLFEERELTENT
ncbi:MAG: ABC transporter ATP-binding protein [Defluviitaleaceae bacterium]|nr:ABC transporter ATP-binding protein [Defluviitaleaceae bacterium]